MTINLAIDICFFVTRYRAINITTPYFKFVVKAGAFNQNQLTSLPGNGIRVRTAQSFNPDQTPQAASYYRETKCECPSAIYIYIYIYRVWAGADPLLPILGSNNNTIINTTSITYSTSIT